MAKFNFTNKAVQDITGIWNYTLNKWSENQADKYYSLLIETCQEIANNPDLGKEYFEVVDKLFGFKTGRHIIFYRCNENDEIEVTRILHVQMDLMNRLNEK